MIRRIRRRIRRLRSERGQVIIMFTGIFVVITVIGLITTDFGLWLSERRGVQRAADLAALAGSLDLLTDPDSDADEQAAIQNALRWAARNGYEDGVDGVEVEVELLCQNNLEDPRPGICHKPSGSGPVHCDPGGDCDGIRVIIRKPGTLLFSGIYEALSQVDLADVHIGSGAAAGLRVEMTPLDTVMAVDATGSMGYYPCNTCHTNSGCPIKEAKDAAHAFTDILLPEGGTLTQLGYTPFRGCYNPPVNYSGCIPTSGPSSPLVELTQDPDAVHNAINNTYAGSYPDSCPGPSQNTSTTNVCLPLLKASEMLQGPNAQQGDDVRKYVVILSDGDNNYSSIQYGSGAAPVQCMPDFRPWQSDTYTDSECRAAQTRERQLDTKTYQLANALKDAGVEIYVVGFGVCGSPNDNLCDPSRIGGSYHDNTADRNLLKCIASSTPGTNDHYYEVPSASDLPQIFQIIAWKIAGRALTE